MVFDKHGKSILRKMFYHGYVGGKHTSIDSLKRSFASHEKGNVEKSIKKLVKMNLVLNHPTSYGKQYSLNPKKIQSIKKIIE